MFGCDEDNPVASVNNKLPLSWAIIHNSYCYFTEDNNKCEGYGGAISQAYKYESVELIDILDTSPPYLIEICNSVIPPILVESDFVVDCTAPNNDFDEYECINEFCFEQDGLPNYYDSNSNTCYQYNYESSIINTCFVNEVNYVQYK